MAKEYNKICIFISNADKDKGSEIFRYLNDRYLVLTSDETKSIEIKKDEITKSKAFICCVTKNYCKSSSMNELNHAISIQKKIIFVIFESEETLKSIY